ncbi:MAG TPA: type II secretion system protein [Candidatus Eisenbacteria bacterium]|nr:type II secretion system protein [Candidatus Eisenbacteria bacterium]
MKNKRARARRARDPRPGFTLIELIVTMVIISVLASAFVAVAAPQINLFFFLPQRLRVQSAGTDLLDIILDGDIGARGLRFAGPTASASAITAATASSLTYTYADDDQTAHTVTFTFSPATEQLTRSVDGAAAQTVPYYARTAAGFAVSAAETNFFRYYDQAGTEFTPVAATLGNIYRVDVAVRVRSGSGAVAESEGGIVLKSGTDIKHFIA